MLAFRRLHLTHFRNYLNRSFSFDGRVVCISGPNGSGKTNLLDAIYYSCFTRSYFNRPDAQHVMLGQSGFRIAADAVLGDRQSGLVAIMRENSRKEFLADNEPYRRFSDHIGRFPCVMIEPDDTGLVTAGGTERRKFLDTLMSQLDHDYLSTLISYNRVLLQRNGLLRGGAPDTGVLDALDQQLAVYGTQVFARRRDFLLDFLPEARERYHAIGGEADRIDGSYESQLFQADLAVLLRDNRARDIYLQRSGYGPHRDDIALTMNGQPARNIASQGQRKSLLFSLKLTEYEMLRSKKGFAPVLLLDDVFEKLDSGRMTNLLRQVCLDEGAQVFITDTHPERLRAAMEDIGVEAQYVET